MKMFYIKDIETGNIKYPVTNIESIEGIDKLFDKIDKSILNDYLKKNDADEKYQIIGDYLTQQNLSENITSEIQNQLKDLNISETINQEVKELSKKIDDLSDKLEMIINALIP